VADPPAAIKELSDLVAGFKPGGDLAHHTLLLAPEVHALLASMLEVATHVDSRGQAERRCPEGGGKAAKAPTAGILNASVIQTALVSAATKFDAFDARFEVERKAAIPAIVAMLSADHGRHRARSATGREGGGGA